MKPKEVLEKWIDCFNKADAYHIAELYATNAVISVPLKWDELNN